MPALPARVSLEIVIEGEFVNLGNVDLDGVLKQLVLRPTTFACELVHVDDGSHGRDAVLFEQFERAPGVVDAGVERRRNEDRAVDRHVLEGGSDHVVGSGGHVDYHHVAIIPGPLSEQVLYGTVCDGPSSGRGCLAGDDARTEHLNAAGLERDRLSVFVRYHRPLGVIEEVWHVRSVDIGIEQADVVSS